MIMKLNINDRAALAIKNNTKRVEIRANKENSEHDYSKLRQNDIIEEEMYKNIKEYDTEDGWTYWCKDEELRGNVNYFLDSNKFFNDKFKEYNIKAYDTSFDRKKVLKKVIDSLE